jgi:hypothetical protein
MGLHPDRPDVVLLGRLRVGVAEQIRGDADLLGCTVDKLGHGAVAEQVGQTCLPKACLVRDSICCRIAALRMGPP